jgi:hypothetical protein
MIKVLFTWLDARPAAYWEIGFTITGIFALWLALALRHERHSQPRRHTSLCFAGLTLALLLAWHWPVLFQATSLNPDEGQLLAAALTYAQDPMPFRSVDLATSGPLNGLVLLPTHWLGVPQDYFNARLVALLLEWGTLLALFGALRTIAAPARAALALLPGIAFFATATDTDFVHYTSERVSVLLLALALRQLLRHSPTQTAAATAPGWGWVGGGITLGLLPWAKLQSVPLGAMVGLWALALCWFDARRPLPDRLRWTGALVSGALAPSIGALASIAVTGQFEQFRTCYLLANFDYTDNGLSWFTVFVQLAKAMHFTWQLPAFLCSSALLLAVHAAWSLRSKHRPGAIYWCGTATTAVALYAVCAPRHAFFHYLMLLVVPLAFWVAAAALELQGGTFSRRTRRSALGVFLFLATVPAFALLVRDGPPKNYGRLAADWRQPYDDIARHIRKISQPGDRLAMWGWYTHLYVETGLAQGTRDAHSELQLRQWERRESFYRPRYLADMQTNRPIFFVDAVGPTAFGYQKRDVNGHETFPALRDFIAANYVLVKDFGPERLYMLREQAAARHAQLPRVVPLALDGFTEKSATGDVMRLGDAPPPPDSVHFYDDGLVFGDLIPHHPLDIFAHAPSRIVHPVSNGTLRLRGAGAIQPTAYADTMNCTDGALFSVWWHASDSVRTLAWQRRLNPASSPADRIPAAFDLSVPTGTTAVEFTIEPGPTPNRDWTYWHDLRFDIRYRP